jgi:hypothetical protein
MPRHKQIVHVGHVVRYRYRLNVLLIEKYGTLWHKAKKRMAQELGVSYRTINRDCNRTMIDRAINNANRLKQYAQYLDTDIRNLKANNTN